MRLIAMFNLKSGISLDDYENWARSRSLPGVRSMVSVSDFNVYRTTGVLFSDERPAFAYIEVLDIDDMEGFEKDAGGDQFAALAGEMETYAETVVFMTTEALSLA